MMASIITGWKSPQETPSVARTSSSSVCILFGFVFVCLFLFVSFLFSRKGVVVSEREEG